MPAIHFRTTVDAEPESVYEALATQDGLAGNWTDQLEEARLAIDATCPTRNPLHRELRACSCLSRHPASPLLDQGGRIVPRNAAENDDETMNVQPGCLATLTYALAGRRLARLLREA